MDPRLNEVLRLVSPACVGVLRELAMLHVQAAKSPGYHSSTNEFSKELKKLMASLPDTDLGIVVLRLGEEAGVKAFFEAEGARRRGNIAEWIFRGMLPDVTPDILTITFVREAAAPKEPLVTSESNHEQPE